MATVGGKVTINGAPVADERISLDASGKEKAEVRTAPDGLFVFPNVTPGTYSVSVAVLAKDAKVTQGGLAGMDWDKPCSAKGFGVLNVPASDKTTGQPAGVLASASNAGGKGHKDKPFTVSAGDRYEQNVTFICATS